MYTEELAIHHYNESVDKETFFQTISQICACQIIQKCVSELFNFSVTYTINKVVHALTKNKGCIFDLNEIRMYGNQLLKKKFLSCSEVMTNFNKLVRGL